MSTISRHSKALLMKCKVNRMHVEKSDNYSERVITHRGVWVLLHYYIYIWLIDAINLGCLFLNVTQGSWIAHTIALFILIGLLFIERNVYDFEKMKFNVIDIIGCCFIVLLGIYKSVYPDTCYDVVTYHIINQEPYWTGNNDFYFFKTSFPLADRVFYLFRFLLGYRLGTLGNTVLLICIFVQVKRVIQQILVSNGANIYEKKEDFLISIGSLSVIMLEGVLMELGTYMTDIVAIPLMLEVLIQIIKQVSRDEKTSIYNMIFVVINLSFIFLCKFVSAIIVCVLLVAYLFAVKKEITVKRFTICLLSALLIVAPLVIYNMYLLGVPLFELSYIFGGYTGNEVLDTRWGGENLFQKIVWPLYMAKYPSERHMELIDMPNLYPLVAIIFIFVEKFQKGSLMGNKAYRYTVRIVLCSFYLWALSGGIDRYAFINLILFGAVLIVEIILFLHQKKIWKTTIITLAVIVQCLGSLYCVLIINNNWQCAPSIIEQVVNGTEEYKNEIEYWFKDKGEITQNGEKYKNFVFADRPYTSWAKLINQDASIYQLNLLPIVSEKKQKEVWHNVENLSKEQLIYTACAAKQVAECINSLNQYQLEVQAIEYINNTYLGNAAVMQVEFGAENSILEFGVNSNNEIMRLKGGKRYQFNALSMVSPYVTWTDEETTIDIYYYDEDGNQFDVIKQSLTPGQVYELEISIDLSDLDNTEEVIVYVDALNNYGLDWNAIQMINPKVVEE